MPDTAKIKKVQQLRDTAVMAALEFDDNFLSAWDSKLARVYNGAGPEWMSMFTRKALTWAIDVFEPAVLIHDYDFTFSDGTRQSFLAANSRLFRNCVRLSIAKYAWYRPWRYRWLRRAVIVWLFCRFGGWSAWLAAYNLIKEQNKNCESVFANHSQTKERKSIMRKTMMWGLVITCGVLFTGCVTETAKITEYNDAGKIVKVTETAQKDAIDKVMAEMAKKNIVIWKQGWYFVGEVTFTGTETYMPCMKFSGGKVNSGHLSIKDGCEHIPAIIQSINVPIAVDVNKDGITVTEKKASEIP